MNSPFTCETIYKILNDYPLCVIDVGAAGGIDPRWTYFGNSKCLRFFGFEPNPDNYDKLINNSITKYFKLAIADRRGCKEFYARSTVGSLSRRYDREALHGEKYKKIEVNVETLEYLRETGVINSLDIVKTDTEGHDLQALQGIGRYLSEETLCTASEFLFYRNTKLSNFSKIDDLMTSNGFLLFGLQTKLGSCGELKGGDVMYIRSVANLLSGSGSNEVKKIRLLKLIAICCFIRNPFYAYIIARAGEEYGLLAKAEMYELNKFIHKKIFILPLLPKLWLGEKMVHILFIITQILSGRVWGKNSIPKINRFVQYEPLFVRRKLIPNKFINSYDKILEKRYKTYKTLNHIWY